MKEPELPTKIYFTVLDMGSGYVCIPSLDDNGGTEYIRKDVLLEWAKERREAVAKEVVIREGVRLGADAAFEELIDKLNEM